VKTAALVASARVALETRRFADALETLSVARSIDPFAEGLAELTEQTLNEQAAAQAEAGKAAGATRETRDRTRTPPMRPRSSERVASDEEATVFLSPGGSDAPGAFDAGRASPDPFLSVEHDAGEETQVGIEISAAPVEDVGEKRPWPLVVGAALMLLATLAAIWILLSW
jgi:cobalamin biosynthesis Mg chelatase CobN